MSVSVPVSIAQVRGGTSLSPHNAPEERMRAFEKTERERLMRTEPSRAKLEPGARVFRIPSRAGFTYVTDQKRRVTDKDGNEITPAESTVVQFKPCGVVEGVGELVLDPSKPVDKRRIEIVEGLMQSDPYLGIFDFLAGREAAEAQEIAEAARRLAEPGRAEQILAAAQALGYDVAGSMVQAVRKLAKAEKGEQPKAEA